jgi:phospholipid/cholesterol/gamma-HCH transport system substrate-binding protein
MAIAREVKVGAFVLAGMIAVGIVIFLIGEEHGVFSPKQRYEAVFSNVEGLKGGSPVRMGGVDVGSVVDVRYSEDSADSSIYVTIAVARHAAGRIRTDSVATIEGKGMLGDKMIVISIGSAPTAVEPGSQIVTEEGGGLEQMLERADAISVKAEKVMENLESTTGTFAEEDFRRDLAQSVKSMSGILTKINEGEGYAARVLSDPHEADQISRLLANLEQTSVELNQTVRNVNAVVARVNNGPGFAHDVIYSDKPTATMESFGAAADEVATSLKGIREGSGPAKGLLYGDENSDELVGNLNAMSSDLRQIVADVRAGKGTLGALLVDPSVYEDIKMILGNVERNATLRALVRYSIQQDETPPGVEVKDPTPAKRSGPGSDNGTAKGDSR